MVVEKVATEEVDVIVAVKKKKIVAVRKEAMAAEY